MTMKAAIKNVIFVKKILANGELCKKCAQVNQRLLEDDLFDNIDQIIIADERNTESEGLRLAQQYDVDRAPFFVVEREDGNTEVYDIYLKFKKAVAKSDAQAKETTEDLIDLIDQHPELDYI